MIKFNAEEKLQIVLRYLDGAKSYLELSKEFKVDKNFPRTMHKPFHYSYLE
ncbi:hypothetical protein SD77_3896 [Bacillus badius]|uniref:Transposase n=1 Tax=Bacillus badius TaxID=1455 RepID=A0ABR5AWW4_BACBA|nr:hypothetical protein SD77_3896 [Bacillus badius]